MDQRQEHSHSVYFPVASEFASNPRRNQSSVPWHINHVTYCQHQLFLRPGNPEQWHISTEVKGNVKVEPEALLLKGKMLAWTSINHDARWGHLVPIPSLVRSWQDEALNPRPALINCLITAQELSIGGTRTGEGSSRATAVQLLPQTYTR